MTYFLAFLKSAAGIKASAFANRYMEGWVSIESPGRNCAATRLDG